MVRSLREDFERLGWQVWMDHEIHGGEQWWREIIRTIQHADVFVFALSQDSWNSQPCREELDYAQRLGLPILPVQVGPLHSVRIPIMETQGVDYRERSANAVLALVAALTELAGRPVERPHPLPEPPKVPFEYLYRIAEVLGPAPIAPDHQEAVISQLRRKLKEERDVVALADIVKLLREFRRRKELTVGNSEEIDQLLAGAEVATAAVREDGMTRLPPSDHWRQSQAADGERAEKPEAARESEEVEPPPVVRRPPRKPPAPPRPAPKVEPAPKQAPAFEWHRAPVAPAPAVEPEQARETSPAWLGSMIGTDDGTPPVRPRPTTEPPVDTPKSTWWKAEEAGEPPPVDPPRTRNGGTLAFTGGVLGAMGIPFGVAALTEDGDTATRIALTLLLIVSVLGVSLGLVSVSRGEQRSRAAVVIAAVGLLGAVLFALTAGHF